MDKALLLENYSKRLGSKGKTRILYLRFAGEFLDYAEKFAKGSLDREAVNDYVDYLGTKNYSDGTINFAFRVIRTLFSRNDLEWPFARGEAPQIREDEIIAPALDPDIIIEMIPAVIKNGKPDEKAFLAIASTYATRKVEMLELNQADVNLKDKTIHISTAKHGRERTHSIPDEILPHLEGYDFNAGISEFGLFTLWYRVEYRIKLPHINQVGFHSIRRTLNTLLLDQLPENVVMSFLRWKQRTSSHMPYRYSAQRFVGREGIETKVVGEAKDVDSKVFAVHPFLKYWR